jgi:hypothetical protein
MNKYIEHIIKDMVRDTDIDYDNDRIRSPFFYYPLIYLSSPSYTNRFLSFPSSPFSMYCKNSYGLTEIEIEYVWDQYKTIIKEKIRNNE